MGVYRTVCVGGDVVLTRPPLSDGSAAAAARGGPARLTSGVPRAACRVFGGTVLCARMRLIQRRDHHVAHRIHSVHSTTGHAAADAVAAASTGRARSASLSAGGSRMVARTPGPGPPRRIDAGPAGVYTSLTRACCSGKRDAPPAGRPPQFVLQVRAAGGPPRGID